MIVKLLELILDQECKTADAACMLLSNLTRNNKNACEVSDLILHTEITAESLINIFTKKQYNCRGCSLNYLGSLFLNLSQGLEFRRFVCIS